MTAKDYEPTPSERPTPLGRFYSDVLYKGDSPADLVIAAERFMIESGVSDSEAMVSAVVAREFEVESGPALSAEEVHDVCVTIPLRTVGWHMEDTLSFAEVLVWYEKVVASLKAKMRTVHDLGCLDSPTFASHDSCEYSRHCPLIYTAKYLEVDLFETQFNNERYKNDVYEAQKLAIHKENIAVKYGLRTTAQAHGMIDLFRDSFDESFHQE